MKDFVAFKKMDGLGRVVIPSDFRRYYGIKADDLLKIVPTENGILIVSAKEETVSEK